MLAWSWIRVDLEKSEIHLGILKPGMKRREVGSVFRLLHKPLWLKILARLCKGEWIGWSNDLSPSLTFIERRLYRINQEFGTNFLIKSRFIKGQRKPQVGLVGG